MRFARGLVLLLLLTQLGCGAFIQGFREGMQQNSTPKTLVTADKRLQVTVPGAWKQNDELNDEADLGADHPTRELYLVMLDESKADFDEMSLEKHSQLTVGAMQEAMKDPQVSEAKSLTINGMPARQHVVRGSVDGVKVVFLHTTLETRSSYCQVLAWTLTSQWEKNEPILRQVVESIQDLEGKPAPSKAP